MPNSSICSSSAGWRCSAVSSPAPEAILLPPRCCGEAGLEEELVDDLAGVVLAGAAVGDADDVEVRAQVALGAVSATHQRAEGAEAGTERQQRLRPAGGRDHVVSHPDRTQALLDADVTDDASYLSNEHHLSRDLRQQAGVFRFDRMIGTERDDPCAFARAAPPWLAEQEFCMLGVTVRISNVFIRNDIARLADLQQYQMIDLLRLQNFGRTSVADLLVVLSAALANGPPLDRLSEEGYWRLRPTQPLLAAVQRSLERFLAARRRHSAPTHGP